MHSNLPLLPAHGGRLGSSRSLKLHPELLQNTQTKKVAVVQTYIHYTLHPLSLWTRLQGLTSKNSIPAPQSRQPSTVWLLLYYLITTCLQQLRAQRTLFLMSHVPRASARFPLGQLLGCAAGAHPKQGFYTQHNPSAASSGALRSGGSRPQGLKQDPSQLYPAALLP